jgi:hypothetical protein
VKLGSLALILALGTPLGACSNSPKRQSGGGSSPSAHLDPDVAPVTLGSWYKPDENTFWQIQLQGTLNTTYNVTVYDIDLFDTSEASIAALQTAGRKVICYFSAGSSENWRDDFGDLSASSMGNELDGWAGERWLDIRSQDVLDLMLARLDLAVEKGCDGVDPDNVNGYQNDTGFDLSAREQLAFNRRIANEARERGLAVALKNDGDQVIDLVDYFDFSVQEECHEFDECALYEPFVAAGKPVFNIEYGTDSATVCAPARARDFRTLIMPLALDGSSRVSCDDP